MEKFNSLVNNVFKHNDKVFKIFSSKKSFTTLSLINKNNFFLELSSIKDYSSYTYKENTLSYDFINSKLNKHLLITHSNKIIEKVKWFSNLKFKSNELNFFDFYQLVLKEEIEKNNLKITEDEKILIEKIKVMYANRKLVFSHNDLHINNILFKKDQVIFIDFDFACYNFEFADLLSFIFENNLDLKNYNAYFLKWKETELKTYYQFYKFVWIKWATVSFLKTNDKEYLKIKKKFIDLPDNFSLK